MCIRDSSSAAQGLADSVNNAANAQINNANTQIANANAQIDSARAVLQQQLDAANAAGNTEPVSYTHLDSWR